jgi:protein-tyrosine phosphatase
MDEALAMARFCVADGITTVVATPHCHRYIHLLKKDILPRVDQFSAQLRAMKIPLTVLPGSEIQVVDTDEYKREFDADLFCHLGAGREYTLLEFNWKRELFPSDAAELIRWIRARGMTPIIAHPERFDYFWEDPARVDRLVEAGAWVQITVDSLLGNHGPSPLLAGGEMLQKHHEAVLATDAHNLERCSGLAVGYEWVRERLGDARADDLFQRAEAVHARLQPQSIQV